MTVNKNAYDVVIIGCGIAGSTMGLLLRRVGCSVLVVDKGQHPRFAIGESTIPLTTALMRYLGRRYDVPEIEELAHPLGLSAHRLVGLPK